ncbi:hypothetical protein Rsub_10810 [Raphidocelis subcapitata]|uniref:Uncharacterized protein n=1 Tax=Raphidocelis subcapitata TaxID=307507 RepID=A0A2V0PFM2_9CHLO|nr:hypothetical protein Rsub_10810 [Raphidocelis subcapitata]|eukprot:GBF98621.1 hypothetical protein Rsub_10810 [Raphidocelis subcapitata]
MGCYRDKISAAPDGATSLGQQQHRVTARAVLESANAPSPAPGDGAAGGVGRARARAPTSAELAERGASSRASGPGAAERWKMAGDEGHSPRWPLPEGRTQPARAPEPLQAPSTAAMAAAAAQLPLSWGPAGRSEQWPAAAAPPPARNQVTTAGPGTGGGGLAQQALRGQSLSLSLDLDALLDGQPLSPHLQHHQPAPPQQQQHQQLWGQQLQQPGDQNGQAPQQQGEQPGEQPHQTDGRQDGQLPTAGAAAAAGGGAPPFKQYYMQRLTLNVVHVLFFAVDAAGDATLAVVGTDVRQTGHFVYATVSDWTAGPPLRCTNRARVMEYLAALGACEPAHEGQALRVPPLAPHHWQALNSADQGYARPQLDRRYDRWREEVGTLPDGRHSKRYYVVDSSSGAERLMVVAEDGARRDRRYAYKAAPDLGGFAFENGKAVGEWLDWALGRTDAPPEFMSRGAPPDRRRAAGRRPDGDGEEGAPAAAANGGGALAAPGGVQQYVQPYAQQHAPPGGFIPLHATAGYAAAAAAGVLSPFGAAGSVLAEHYPVSSHHQQQHYQQQHHHAMQLNQHSPAGHAAGPQPSPASAASAAVAAAVASDLPAHAAAELAAIFSSDPGLARWVTAAPSQFELQRFRLWACRLRPGAIVDDGSQQGWPGGDAGAPRQLPPGALPASEALQALRDLEAYPVTMRLLHATGIARAVAACAAPSGGAPAAVRDAAARVAQAWQRAAARAVEVAHAALAADGEAYGGRGGGGGGGIGGGGGGYAGGLHGGADWEDDWAMAYA